MASLPPWVLAQSTEKEATLAISAVFLPSRAPAKIHSSMRMHNGYLPFDPFRTQPQDWPNKKSIQHHVCSC